MNLSKTWHACIETDFKQTGRYKHRKVLQKLHAISTLFYK